MIIRACRSRTERLSDRDSRAKENVLNIHLVWFFCVALSFPGVFHVMFAKFRVIRLNLLESTLRKGVYRLSVVVISNCFDICHGKRQKILFAKSRVRVSDERLLNLVCDP